MMWLICFLVVITQLLKIFLFLLCICITVFSDKLGNEDEEKVSVIADLESIITFFCKSRQETYSSDNGWLDILQPLLSLNLGKSDLYNCFYSILNKYVPR